MHAEFNSVVLFTVLYSPFQHCATDMSKVTAQRTILEYDTLKVYRLSDSFCHYNFIISPDESRGYIGFRSVAPPPPPPPPPPP